MAKETVAEDSLQGADPVEIETKDATTKDDSTAVVKKAKKKKKAKATTAVEGDDEQRPGNLSQARAEESANNAADVKMEQGGDSSGEQIEKDAGNAENRDQSENAASAATSSSGKKKKVKKSKADEKKGHAEKNQNNANSTSKKKNRQTKTHWVGEKELTPDSYTFRALRKYENADEKQKEKIIEEYEQKYRMIRFLERKKSEKNAEKARKKVMAALEENDSEKEASARTALAEAEADTRYVKKFPHYVPYLSLFPKQDSPESAARRKYMRKYIDDKVKKNRDKFDSLEAAADKKQIKGSKAGMGKGKGKKTIKGNSKGASKGKGKGGKGDSGKGKGKGAAGKGEQTKKETKNEETTEQATRTEVNRSSSVAETTEPARDEKKAKPVGEKKVSDSGAAPERKSVEKSTAETEFKQPSKKRPAENKVATSEDKRAAADAKRQKGNHESFMASQAPHRQGAIVKADNKAMSFDSDSD
ncbi:unnamed protein product [Amoebophrya sp. A120]|nr:unnamed protein product [Amoebophrya sp. A120]|eukprot:GSA120T00011415001.1